MSDSNFDAFISYSHSDCGNIAPALQKGIENIGKPWYRINRNLNVFRDETNLAATPELWTDIKNALLKSDNLILIASPRAAKSSWINDEINLWIDKYWTLESGIQNIIIVLANGNICWNRSENDFDWDLTDCLPKALSRKFNYEPLWIDLKPYVISNAAGKSLDYKASGFTFSISRVAGAILNKEPREIESLELTRSKKIRALITISSVLFISIAVIAFTFLKQKKFEQKVSLSYNLIAEANGYRALNDIGKALMYYAYAYKVYPADANYSILKSFYEENATISYESGDSIHSYIFNRFYSKILTKENIADTLYSEIYDNLFLDDNSGRLFSYEYENEFVANIPNICLPMNCYFSITSNGLVIHDLITDNISNVYLNLENLSSYYFNPKSTKIFFQFDNQDTMISSFDLQKNRLDLILSRKTSKDYFSVFFNKDTLYSHIPIVKELFLEEFFVVFSDNNRYLLLSHHNPVGNLKISLIDLQESKIVISSQDLDLDDYAEYVSNAKLSDDGQYLYIKWSSAGNGGWNDNVVYRLDPGELMINGNFHKGSGYRNSIINEPFPFKWIIYDDEMYALYGLYGGQLVVADFSDSWDSTEYGASYFMVASYPKSYVSPITCMEVSNDYLIAGTDKGAIHVFDNFLAKEVSQAIERGGNTEIVSFQLPSSSALRELIYDTVNNCLYSQNDIGEIYKFNFNKSVTLERDSEMLLKQLKDLGINDLSVEEKRKYKIVMD